MGLDAMLELGKQATGRNDIPRVRDLMRDTMLMASDVIRQQRAGDRLPDVRERCRGSAQAYVQAADRCSSRHGDKLDVFNAAMDAFRCHVTETWIVDLALNGNRIWASDAADRPEPDLGPLDILGRRLEDLAAMRQHLEESGRIQLLQRLDVTIAELGLRQGRISDAARSNSAAWSREGRT